MNALFSSFSYVFGWAYRRVRESLRRDLFAKAVCLVFATLLYLFLKYGALESFSFQVNVTPDTTSSGELRIAKIQPESVTVTVRGPADAIRAFDNFDNLVRLTVGATKPKGSNERSVRLSSWMVSGIRDHSLRVVSIEPSRVEVTFDEETTLEFPVLPPDLLGNPALKNCEPSVVPLSALRVDVRGPRTVLEKYAANQLSFATEPIDLTSRVEDFKTSVRIKIPANMENIQLVGPGTLEVSVALNDQSVSKDVSAVPVLLAANSGDGHRYVCEPESVRVIVEGLETAVNRISSEDIVALVDCHVFRVTPPPEAGALCRVRAALRDNKADGLSLRVFPEAVSVKVVPEVAPVVPPAESTPEPEDDPSGGSLSVETAADAPAMLAL